MSHEHESGHEQANNYGNTGHYTDEEAWRLAKDAVDPENLTDRGIDTDDSRYGVEAARRNFVAAVAGTPRELSYDGEDDRVRFMRVNLIPFDEDRQHWLGQFSRLYAYARGGAALVGKVSTQLRGHNPTDPDAQEMRHAFNSWYTDALHGVSYNLVEARLQHYFRDMTRGDDWDKNLYATLSDQKRDLAGGPVFAADGSYRPPRDGYIPGIERADSLEAELGLLGANSAEQHLDDPEMALEYEAYCEEPELAAKPGFRDAIRDYYYDFDAVWHWNPDDQRYMSPVARWARNRDIRELDMAVDDETGGMTEHILSETEAGGHLEVTQYNSKLDIFCELWKRQKQELNDEFEFDIRDQYQRQDLFEQLQQDIEEDIRRTRLERKDFLAIIKKYGAMPRHWDRNLPGEEYWSEELSAAREADTFVGQTEDAEDLHQYGPSSVARYYPLSWWGPRGIDEPAEDTEA